MREERIPHHWHWLGAPTHQCRVRHYFRHDHAHPSHVSPPGKEEWREDEV